MTITYERVVGKYVETLASADYVTYPSCFGAIRVNRPWRPWDAECPLAVLLCVNTDDAKRAALEFGIPKDIVDRIIRAADDVKSTDHDDLEAITKAALKRAARKRDAGELFPQRYKLSFD